MPQGVPALSGSRRAQQIAFSILPPVDSPSDPADERNEKTTIFSSLFRGRKMRNVVGSRKQMPLCRSNCSTFLAAPTGYPILLRRHISCQNCFMFICQYSLLLL